MRSLAAPLRAAGLRRVNIHIDTLNPDRLPRIMRWGSLDELWSGLEACEAAGLAPMKLNAVIARGYNDEDVVDLARLTLARPWTVRFIELMPLGSGDEAQVAVDRYVSSDEVAERIRGALGELAPRSGSDPADEAQYFTLPGAAGTIGFISPVSAPYCGTCNRMRLTADGRFHLCLLHDQEIDVRSVLRAGGDADSVRATLLEAIRRKPVGHSLDRGVHTMDRRMHALGG
jgi:cyclic pyranopterin phosphate synthase